MTGGVDVSRFVVFNPAAAPARYYVGHGDSRRGMRGTLLGTVCLRHCGDYEAVLHLDNGRIDSFNPLQLIPEHP